MIDSERLIFKERNKKFFRDIIIGILGLFLVYALYQYINAFFGALIIFILFRPLYKYLTKKKIKPWISAIIIITLSLLLILILLFSVINSLVLKSSYVFENKDYFINTIKLAEKTLKINFSNILEGVIPEIINFLKNIILSVSKEILFSIINLFIMCFIVFYLFIEEDYILKIIYEYSPFKKENTKKLILEFKKVTYCTLIATGIIAIIQGGILGLLFLVFRIPNPFFWGMIGVIVSFLPVIGVPIIWIPVVIWKFIEGEYGIMIGMLIGGIILSYIDNILRPIIQNKFGKIHPIISIIGIFMGISIFGLIGMVVGTLLLCYFILLLKIIIEENPKVFID